MHMSVHGQSESYRAAVHETAAAHDALHALQTGMRTAGRYGSVRR